MLSLLLTASLLTAQVPASPPASSPPADLRTWVLTPPEPLRLRIGSPSIEGRLAEVRGFDAEHSRAVAIIRRPDGTLRSVTAAWLDPESRAIVDAWPDPRSDRRGRRAAEAPIPTRDDIYPRQGPGSEGIERHETENFVFHWGGRRDGSGAAWFEPGFQDRTYAAFEDARDFYRDVLQAPLPGRHPASDLGAGTKTNVYITGTGLPHHEEGFAFGALDVIIHPAALAPGSGVVPHEFAHCVQLASTGFRDSEHVGWFWENHAEWCTHQYFPGHAPSFHAWLERRHYELNSSRMNYGSWMWLQVMTEDPELGPEFVFRLWTENRRNARGASIEDPIQTALRLLSAMPAIGSAEAAADRLGSIIASVARRTAFWSDLVHGLSYAESEAEYETHAPGALRHRGTLRPVTGARDASDVFLVPYSQAPRDFGVHIVDLIPADGAPDVAVRLHGLHPVDRPRPAEHAATWRWSLLVERADGTVEGVDGRSGDRLTITRRANDRGIRLAVAATPPDWEPIDFRPGYNRKRRFPYAVQVTGATPRTEPERSRESAWSGDSPLVRHPNGGGLRSPQARVAATAYIGPQAMVLGAARVSEDARILDHAVVRDRANISGRAVVRGTATIRDQARVGGDAMVAGAAVLTGSVSLEDRVRVLEAIHLHGDGRVGGDVLAKGWGEIHTRRSHPLGGWLFFGEDCEVHLPEDLEAVALHDGRVYGFMATDQWREPRASTGSLTADWLPASSWSGGRPGAVAGMPTAFVPDRTADHPLTLLGEASIDAAGQLDARTGAAAAEGTPIAGAGWSIEMDIDAVAPGGGAIAAIHYADGRGTPRRLHLVATDGGVQLRLDGEPIADRRGMTLAGPTTLACDADGRLVLRAGGATMLRARLPEPWQRAIQEAIVFSGARLAAIRIHRTASPETPAP